MSEPLLLVLVGPTASGKTALALALAEHLSGEVVSCDSVAVYRECEIGTAKPSLEERRRVPHHLIDIAPPDGLVTAGDYSRLARAAIADINARGKIAIVVGGTGLYLRALLDGLFAGPARSEEVRERLRKRVSDRGAGYVHRVLRRLDPAAAASIHPNDVPKAIRAVEICIRARRKMTEMWREGRDPLRGFRVLRIGLHPDRDQLYQRINTRACQMFSQGLVEETRALRERYGATAQPLCSLGYKQAAQYLKGELSLEQAIAAAQQGHRNYAKRQLTWFRREPDVHWLLGFGSEPTIQQEALSRITRMLSGREELNG
jgi:tRNA dimethylallyltransferase